MAKMMNANSMNDMTIMNAKSQAKQQQLMAKIGRGKRRVKVNLTKVARNYLNILNKEFEAEIKKIATADFNKTYPNIPHFIKYIDNETKITKENKKIKEKDVLFSFEEHDFLKLQLRESIKALEKSQKELKWYNFLNKIKYSYAKKQAEITLEEFLKTTTVK